MYCDLKVTGDTNERGFYRFTCDQCNRDVWWKRKPDRMCQAGEVYVNHHQDKDTPKLPPRTTEQRLQVIATNCYTCPESSHKGNKKTLHSINCPKSCGCASNRARPMMEQLAALSFKCPLGNRLDSKLEDMQKAIDSL